MAVSIPRASQRPQRVPTRRGLRPGTIAVLIAAFVVLPALLGIGYYHINVQKSDFLLYYRDARVGWVYGWSQLYNLADFDAITRQLPIHNSDPNAGSLALPLLSWLVAPFALLPPSIAYAAWFIFLTGVAVLAWKMAAPAVPFGQSSHLAIAAVFLPLVFGMTLGSAVVLVLAAVAACWWLIQHNRPIIAGLVLSVTLVRPQVAWLIPVCLLLAGFGRVFIGYFAGAIAIATGTVLTIPAASLVAYAHTMGSVGQHPASWQVAAELTVVNLRPWPVALMLAIAIACVALTVSVLSRRSQERDAIAMIAGIVGSLLLTPYLHLQDLALWLPALWLGLRWLPSRRWPLALFPVVAVANFDLSVRTSMPVLLEVGCLCALLLSLLGAKRRGVVAVA